MCFADVPVVYQGVDERRTGTFRCREIVHVVTNAVPLQRLAFLLICSNSAKTAEEAARKLTSANLYFSDGKFRGPTLNQASAWDGWAPSMLTASAGKFKPEILEYDSENNTYLVKDDFQQRLQLVPKSVQQLKERLPFDSFRYPDSREFARVTKSEFQDIVQGDSQNMLLSGCPGTGKTWFVNHVIKPALHASLGGRKSAAWFTATTGQAAELVGGLTIHSAGGLGRGKGTADDAVRKMKKSVKDRYGKVRVVVIEECSLISAKFLELFDAVAKSVRNDERPYGGIRVILVGKTC